LGWVATCGVLDPLGSGWPPLVVDVVDPPLLDVLDVVLATLVDVLVPLVVDVVPCAVVVVTGRVVVVVVGDGIVVVVRCVVDVVVAAPTTPVIPMSTAIVAMPVPVVRRRDRLARGRFRSRMGAGLSGAPRPRPVAAGRSLVGFEHGVAILLPPQALDALVGYGKDGPEQNRAPATKV
jgi:hypothetical protein